MIRVADLSDVSAIAALAARLFPLAGPPDLDSSDTAAFAADTLSESEFGRHLADPASQVFVAEAEGALVGYALAHYGPQANAPAGWRDISTTYLSKLYVDPARHGSGLAADLLNAVVSDGRARQSPSVWLGVNRDNMRAKRFYAKFGFRLVDERRFAVGDRVFVDDVLVLAADFADGE